MTTDTTPARLRELADRFPVYSHSLGPEIAAALRAAAASIAAHERLRREVASALALRVAVIEELSATLAAREALLRRAMSELQNCVSDLIGCQSLVTAEYANALAAEIAAALESKVQILHIAEEKDNG